MLSVWVFVMPFFAHAHATPTQYIPEAGSTEKVTPPSISIRFTERVEMGASSVTVFGPDGMEVNVGKGVQSEIDPRVLEVPITDHKEGVYTVSWQVVSVDDGHFTKGAFSFLVDATGKKFEGDAEGIEINYSSKLPEAILSFLMLLAESIFIAVIVLCAFIIRPFYARNTEVCAPTKEAFAFVSKHMIAVGCILFIGSGALTYLHKTLELAALQNVSLIQSALLYVNSSVGMFLLLKMLLVAVIGLVFMGSWKKIWGGHAFAWSHIVIIVLLLCLVYMQAYISHAAASLFLPEWSVFVTFIHLACKELIVGVVIILFAVCVHTALLKKSIVLAPIFGGINFLVALALLLAGTSGAYITWLHLKHTENLFMTEWGIRFFMLLGATLIFGALHLFNQFFVQRHIAHNELSRKISLCTLALQVGIGLCILFYSAYVGMTTPPFTVAQYTYSESVVSEDTMITLQAHPYDNDSFRLLFTSNKNNKSLDPLTLIVTATNNENNIGPNVLAVQKLSDGAFTFPFNDLTPQGTWNIDVSASPESGYDLNGTFDLVYPEDIENSKMSDQSRAFDWFALFIICISVAIACLSFVLAFYARKQIQAGVMASPFRLSFSPRELLSAVVGTVLLCACVVVGFSQFGNAAFKHECEQDGHVWRQSLPTRERENISPNAILGCSVGEGEYHFVDHREYLLYTQTEADRLQ